MRSTSLHNWSKIDQPATLVADSDRWTMSFILGISKEKIEEILASDRSINSKSFTWFIYDIWKNNAWGKDKKGKQVIILDNSSVHNRKESLTFMKKKWIKCISIPPYSPQLNAAEKVIGAIKIITKQSGLEERDWVLPKLSALSTKWLLKVEPNEYIQVNLKFFEKWKVSNFEVNSLSIQITLSFLNNKIYKRFLNVLIIQLFSRTINFWKFLKLSEISNSAEVWYKNSSSHIKYKFKLFKFGWKINS